MGMEEGLTQAVGQIDAILAEESSTPPRSRTDESRRRRRQQTPQTEEATMTTMTEPTTKTLDAPGATLTYDVRKADTTSRCCS